MANRTLTADVVAKIALPILENELGVVKTIHRAYEDEFTSTVNGYKKGETISIRRPADFTVRTGAVVDLQDVIEGKTTLTIDTQKGVDFKFSSSDMTLKVEDLAERVIRPAMSSLANEITNDVLTTMYKGLYNWAGTPGEVINSFSDFSKGALRADLMAIPQGDRTAILSPEDHWGMLGTQTGLFIQDAARGAYRSGDLGVIGGIRTMMSQVVPTHVMGTSDDSTPVVNQVTTGVTYDSVKDTWAMDLITGGHDNPTTLKAGDVFHIVDCYMVNPKTRARTTVLQQFVVNATVVSTGAATLSISPPIITSGPHQTVAYADGVTDLNTKALVFAGTASMGYLQNMIYHKNCMALAMVPMEIPQGVSDAARQSYKGFSARVIPGYDFVNDISRWRLDVLYGKKVVDPRLGLRLSGTGA